MMAHITIYGITEDGVYAEGGDGFVADDLYEDSYAGYHYDGLENIPGDQEAAEDLAELLSTGDHDVTVARDENWWYIMLDQETIDAYFVEMYKRFREKLKELNECRLEDMMDWYSSPLRHLNEIYRNENSFMTYSMENGWLTLEDFMRCAKPGRKYYICGAVDAHIA